MYNNVYLHKTVQASAILVEKMMLVAKEDLNLIEKTKDLDEFVWLNDTTLMGKVMTLNSEHPARRYLERLMTRKLPKLIKEFRIFEEDASIADIADDAHEVIETRYIGGIDTSQFDRYRIYFLAGERSLTCQEALAKEMYVEPRHPRKLVRIYDL